ncbi:hypothetical protein [Clostridium senegalense]|uniref:hypothetical protein n=1 Tax=Clostridium senegalense TaxID=1465809 RepID=UPI000288E8D7|nr:hypothetical protein [Clostridium senegalense]
MQERLQELRKKNARTELRKEIKEAKEFKENLNCMNSFVDTLISIGELVEQMEGAAQDFNNMTEKLEPDRDEATISTNAEMNQYKVITRDDFIRYKLSRLSASQITDSTVNNLKRHWKKVSCGFNFMIATGTGELMFYSVNYFSNYILGEHKGILDRK